VAHETGGAEGERGRGSPPVLPAQAAKPAVPRPRRGAPHARRRAPGGGGRPGYETNDNSTPPLGCSRRAAPPDRRRATRVNRSARVAAREAGCRRAAAAGGSAPLPSSCGAVGGRRPGLTVRGKKTRQFGRPHHTNRHGLQPKSRDGSLKGEFRPEIQHTGVHEQRERAPWPQCSTRRTKTTTRTRARSVAGRWDRRPARARGLRAGLSLRCAATALSALARYIMLKKGGYVGATKPNRLPVSGIASRESMCTSLASPREVIR